MANGQTVVEIIMAIFRFLRVLGQNRGSGGAILIHNEHVLTFVLFYLCATFGENRSRNATVRVRIDRQTV